MPGRGALGRHSNAACAPPSTISRLCPPNAAASEMTTSPRIAPVMSSVLSAPAAPHISSYVSLGARNASHMRRARSSHTVPCQAMEERVAELEEENDRLRTALNMPPAQRPALGKGPTGKDKPRPLSLRGDGSDFPPEAGPSGSGHTSSPGSVNSAPSLSPTGGANAARLSPGALDWVDVKAADMMQPQHHPSTISPSITPGPYSSAYGHPASAPPAPYGSSPLSPPFSATHPSPVNTPFSQPGVGASSYMGAPPPSHTPRPQSPYPYAQTVAPTGRAGVATPMYLSSLQSGGYPSPAERSQSHQFSPGGYMDSAHAYVSPISAGAHEPGMPSPVTPMLHRPSPRDMQTGMSVPAPYPQRRSATEPHAFRSGHLGNHHGYMGPPSMEPQHTHLSPTHAADSS
jgi:hypothetical protein